MAWFYTFNPPKEIGGDRNTKPGITFDSLPDKRLGKYQLPYGPCWEAHYTWLCSHPDPVIIKEIEGAVLGHFKTKNNGLGPGMTEWIVETSWEEVRNFVVVFSKDNNIQITDHGVGPWNPIKIQKELSGVNHETPNG